MKSRVNVSPFLLAASLLLAAAPSAYAQTGDAARAKNKISMCIGCHGIAGSRTAYPEVYNVPLIGGQSEGYLVSALKAYRSGERAHPSMRAIAGNLSDGDMADIAAYYARAKPAK